MIPDEQRRTLAELYDGFANPLDPLDPKAEEFESAFAILLDELHASHAPSVPYADFKRLSIRQCREWLRKNPPQA
jgi:hypothetical protein